MIRRNPTRIELKLEDLSEFESIHKLEKKKVSPVTGSSGPEAQKLLRQERIGHVPVVNNPASSSSSLGATTRSTHFRRIPIEPPPTTRTIVRSMGIAHIDVGDSTTTTPTPTNPSTGGTAANGAGLPTPSGSSIVVHMPSSFDEFGGGIGTSQLSPSSLTTPTNNGNIQPTVSTNSSNISTTTSMEMSLEYLNE